MKKGLVAVSGGVDSTAVMRDYIRNGVDVDGVMMRVHNADESAVADAKSACEKLGTSLHILNLEDEFKKLVIDEFVNEYLNCRTPNPCIMCNIRMKFEYLLILRRNTDMIFLQQVIMQELRGLEIIFISKRQRILKKTRATYFSA